MDQSCCNPDSPSQVALIAGYYHCDQCNRTVDHVQRTRGYWLCDECWTTIMPDWDRLVVTRADGERRDAAWYASTAAERTRIEAYWQWYNEIQQRKPLPKRRGRAALYRSYLAGPALLTSDDYYPLCACGQPRPTLGFMPRGAAPGLFGGPYRRHCPVCEARLKVEAVYNLISIHPDWDDEQWLDSLQKTMQEAFTLGVLPDYWFRLRYPEMYTRT